MNKINVLRATLFSLVAIAAVGCAEKAPDVVTTPGSSTTIVKDQPSAPNVVVTPSAPSHTSTNTTTTPAGTTTTTTG